MRNKLYSLSRMPDVSADYFMSRQPSTVAWSSVKYEWGKQRAIYGVDITNFIISGYGMAGCEDVLAGRFPIGKAANEENVKRTVTEVLKNGVPFCFDFEDFNSQHSNEVMGAVLDAYLTTFMTKLDPAQCEAIVWVKNALYDTLIHGGDGIDYTTKGTLLSGWRLTTFMNTVLNYVYTRVITAGTQLVSTHNGDDVLAAVCNLKQVYALQENAKTRGIRFQSSKCYLAAIAEFLRIDHKTGVGAQYLPRAVSTFVHGATESAVPNDLRSLVKSIMTRRKELLQRGADIGFVNKTASSQLNTCAKLWKVDKKTHIQYS